MFVADSFRLDIWVTYNLAVGDMFSLYLIFCELYSSSLTTNNLTLMVLHVIPSYMTKVFALFYISIELLIKKDSLPQKQTHVSF